MNVHHFIVTNVWNINKQFQVPVLQETITTEDDIDVEMTDNTAQVKESLTETNNEDEQEDDNPHDKSLSENQPTTEPYSLREWFYDLTDTDNEALIHAVYPTADDNKLLVLCEKQKSIKVLHILHNLADIAGTDFHDEALKTYFGENKQNPTVLHDPRTTAQTTAYDNHLTSFVTAGNPQDVTQSQQPQQNTQRNAKRNREGDLSSGQNPTTYAAAVQESTGPVNYGADVNDLMTRLNTNLKNLDTAGQKQKLHDQAITNYEARFNKVEEGLTGHGVILNTLALTQEKQGALMTTLNEKMDGLTEIMTGNKPDDHMNDPLSKMNEQAQASNPSHGTLGVLNHE